MNPHEEQQLLLKVELMLKRLSEAEELLRQCLPFVELHYYRSAAGFGQGARTLMNRIKALLGVK